MGWTTCHATHYKNGKVDRKAEIDAMWNSGSNKVLKSSMVGSVYYGAIEGYIDDRREVFAVIYKTNSGEPGDPYFNFGYSDHDETEGPCEYDCPESILKLLTPTTSVYANAWREKCKKKAEFKKRLNSLNYGDTIRWHNGDKVHLLVKHAPAYQFKTWFWACASGGYVPKSHLSPDNVEF